MDNCNLEMYKNFCKARFDTIEKTQQRNHEELMDILKGKNGDPGLIDNVRDNTKLRNLVGKMTWLFLSAFVVQSVALIFFLIKDKL